MKNLRNNRWVISYSIFLIGITTIPYLLGYFYQGENWRFTGFVFGVEDGNSYIAKMISGFNGNWLFRSPYSIQDQKGFIGFFPYILLGKLVSYPELHDQLVAIFHFYRMVAGSFEIYATYKFISIFIKKEEFRKIGVVVATAGGGLGWLAVLGLQAFWGNRLPLEFYSPETFGLLSIYGLPHLAMARGLLLFGILYLLKAKQNQKYIYYSGICISLIGFFQPLTIVTAWSILCAYCIAIGLSVINIWIKEKKVIINNIIFPIKHSIIVIAISSPFVIYNSIIFKQDSYLNKWYSQNVITSPPIQDYLMGFGLLLIPLIWGIWILLRDIDYQKLILFGWIAIFPLLAYAPYNLQRRLPDGIWICVVIIAFIGLENIKYYQRQLIYFVLGFSLITSFMIISTGIFAVIKPESPVFLPKNEVIAFNYIFQTATPNDIILTSYQTGNLMPAWAPIKVLTGLGPESADLGNYSKVIRDIYQSNITDNRRMELINIYQIRYIFWGPEEQEIGDWDPEKSTYLSRIYEKGPYKIFKVDLIQ